MSTEHWWNANEGCNEVLAWKPVTVTLYAPRIPRGDRGKTPSFRGIRGVCVLRSDRPAINRLSNGADHRYSRIN